MLLGLALSGLIYLIEEKYSLLGLTHPTLVHIRRRVEAKGFDEKKKKPHRPKISSPPFLFTSVFAFDS